MNKPALQLDIFEPAVAIADSEQWRPPFRSTSAAPTRDKKKKKRIAAAAARPPSSEDWDELVPDLQVAAELHISMMALWRWDRDKKLIELGFPPRISLRKRNYRSRKVFEKFKQNLLQQAVEERAARPKRKSAA